MLSSLLSAQERNVVAQAASPRAEAPRRLALVIGNGAYAETPLKNPLNDARAMAAKLRSLGFEVISRENANIVEMDEAVREFGVRLESAQMGLFYFAGHGMQVKGRNYLIPIGASFRHEDEVAYRSFDVGQVLDKMDSAKTRINLMILDACRTNPFHKFFQARRQGLAEMEAPVGTLIAFATAPGSVALDGAEDHGVYTKHLLRHMDDSGIPVEQAFKRVRVGVSAETGERQIPWESSSLRDEFQFRPVAAGAAGLASEAALELAFWEAIKDSPRADDYAAYLEQFPKGRFAALARNRRKDLQKPLPPVVAAPPAATAAAPVTPPKPAPPVPTAPPVATAMAAPAPTKPAPTAPRPPAAAPVAPATLPPPVAASPAPALANLAPPATAAASGESKPLFRLDGAKPAALSFSADAAWLAVASSDGRVQLLKAGSGEPERRFSLGQALSAIRFAADGRTLAVGTELGETLLLDLNGKELWRRRPHTSRVVTLAFSPDGRYLLSAAAKGELELATVAKGETVQRLRGEELPLVDAQYSPEGRYLGVVLGEGKTHVVKVVELGSGRQMLATAATAASFSVNGRYLLVAAGGHTPTLFDIASGAELRRFARFPLSVVAGAYAESGQFVATVDAEGRGLLLDTRDGSTAAAVRATPAQPRAVAFTNDALRYALIDGEGSVLVYRFGEK